MYKHILVPTDGSELAQRAVQPGIELAKALGARIHFVTVTEPFHVFSVDPEQVADSAEEYRAHARSRAERLLANVAGQAREAGLICETSHLEGDHPYEAILSTAKAFHCDLVIMASHGRRGMSALVLGSETVKVLTHTHIPVLVCR